MEKLLALEYPKNKHYIKATLNKDLYKKDIIYSGNLPRFISKGYQTWFSYSTIPCRSVVHPEDNRWLANIPFDYFTYDEEVIYSNEEEDEKVDKEKNEIQTVEFVTSPSVFVDRGFYVSETPDAIFAKPFTIDEAFEQKTISKEKINTSVEKITDLTHLLTYKKKKNFLI